MGDPSLEEITRLIKTIDKAISMERHARSFYEVASERIQSAEGSKILRWLADFEDAHHARLTTKRDEFLQEIHDNESDYPPPEITSGLSETGPDSLVDDSLTETEILMLAIENEKRAQSFYERKSNAAGHGPLKDLLLELMREEERHIKILVDQHRHIEINRVWGSLEEVQKQYGS